MIFAYCAFSQFYIVITLCLHIHCSSTIIHKK